MQGSLSFSRPAASVTASAHSEESSAKRWERSGHLPPLKLHLPLTEQLLLIKVLDLKDIIERVCLASEES